MAELEEGKKAPAFALKDKDGNTHRLNEIEAPYTVVYFYPRDNTPGCTVEAQGFQEHLKAFQKLGVAVIGISGGDEKSKAKFCAAHKLTFPLLSDPGFEVSEKYGAYGDKKFMGKTSRGILRKTYVLDAAKRILKIYKTVRPSEHPAQVLAFIKEHGAQQ